ncbi:PucR family transcriptional regulator [Nocardia sp. NPDC004068]|uniref:PucR family transcriptional regulator n=1 Tax=Nocardia sp. NPDC004068 TaxID=3364303 RepID=UPI0036892CC1
MTTDTSDRTATPFSAPLADVRVLSERMVAQVLDPGSADSAELTQACLRLVVAMLEGTDVPGRTRELDEAAAGWARDGLPLNQIHHAVHEGFRLGLDLARPDHGIIEGTRRVVEILGSITTTVSAAYLRELRAILDEQHTAVHTVASALLTGRVTSSLPREYGIRIASRYAVLALHIPHDDHAPDDEHLARVRLRRVRLAVSNACEAVLPLLDGDGGTLLVPADSIDLDRLLAALSTAARIPLTATVVDADTDDIPDAAQQAHRLLEVVRRAKSRPGLYRFDDLALEFQLTLPGPGREHLSRLLDPLDDHPELLATLHHHIDNNLNRQRTARILHLHPNSVDNRLKRIATLTGCDPTHTTGLWYLRAALVTRDHKAGAEQRIARSLAAQGDPVE